MAAIRMKEMGFLLYFLLNLFEFLVFLEIFEFFCIFV